MLALELRHLRTLAALRDTGSLVEAAERVYLTQSALSHQLKDLEDRLGCPLFVRKTRPLRFTSAGKRLLRLADEVLPMVHGAQRDLERLAGGESGRLHMAIECHSCFEWLLPAINRYRESWPDVELDIASGFNFAPLPALGRGDLDLVITADPMRELDVTYCPLFSYEAQLAVAPSHPLAKKEVDRTGRSAQRGADLLSGRSLATRHVFVVSRSRRRRTAAHTHRRTHGDDDSARCERPRRHVSAELGAARISEEGLRRRALVG